MFFKLPLLFILSLLTLIPLAQAETQGQVQAEAQSVLRTDSAINANVYAKPQRCIGLRQGQVCYQKVLLNWQTNKVANYCLHKQKDKKPLQCWKNSDKGSYKFVFESPENIKVKLYDDNNRALAETTISVSWVYKTRKPQQRSWRLF